MRKPLATLTVSIAMGTVALPAEAELDSDVVRTRKNRGNSIEYVVSQGGRNRRKVSVVLVAIAAIALFASSASAELGSDNPTDATLVTQREVEAGCDTSTMPPTCPSGSANVFNSGTFDIASPPARTMFKPIKRVRRDKFGVVGPFILNNGLTEKDLDNLVYPDATETEKDKLVEGLQFFTMFHTAAQGLGPINNQPACIGCATAVSCAK